MMFRITDESAHATRWSRAVNRGVPVRLITDETEYRNPRGCGTPTTSTRCGTPASQVRFDGHQGINHAKAGAAARHRACRSSARRTGRRRRATRSASTTCSRRKPWIYNWLEALFERKWTNGHGQIGDQAVRAAAAGPARPTTCPANTGTNVPTTGVVAVVRCRAVGAPLRHLFRDDAESAAARDQQAARPEPVPHRLPLLPRCPRCSRARATTGRSSRRRWRTSRPTDRSGASPPPARRRTTRRRPSASPAPPRGDLHRAGVDRGQPPRPDSDGTIDEVEFFARHHVDRRRHGGAVQRRRGTTCRRAATT